MPAFDLINVQVALGGDIRSIVDRSAPENGVTFPEYEILAKIHGAGSMRGAEVSGETVTRTQSEERDRLMSLYGEEAMTAVYAGSSTNLPTKAPEEFPRADEAQSKKKGKAKAEKEQVEAEPEPEPEPEPEAEDKEPEEEKHGRTKSKIKDLPKE